MLIHFISMMIMPSMGPSIFLNTEMNNCPSFGFHMILMSIFTFLLYLAFNINGQNYGLHQCEGFDGAYVHVNLIDHFAMLNNEGCMFKGFFKFVCQMF
jgi:hypothetical protein